MNFFHIAEAKNEKKEVFKYIVPVFLYFIEKQA